MLSISSKKWYKKISQVHSAKYNRIKHSTITTAEYIIHIIIEMSRIHGPSYIISLPKIHNSAHTIILHDTNCLKLRSPKPQNVEKDKNDVAIHAT